MAHFNVRDKQKTETRQNTTMREYIFYILVVRGKPSFGVFIPALNAGRLT